MVTSEVLTLTTSPSTTSACASPAPAGGASTPLWSAADGLAASPLFSVGTLRLRPDCARSVPAPEATTDRLKTTVNSLLIFLKPRQERAFVWAYDVMSRGAGVKSRSRARKVL